MKRMKIILGVCLLPASLYAAADILVSDFEFARWPDQHWTTTGNSFGDGPASGSIGRQMPVSNFQGKGLVNSFFGGSDRATGTLTSAPFTIERPYLNFLIGGGGWEGKTCIHLLVDGEIVRTATGDNVRPGGSEALAWKSWDIKDLAGKQASIQIVDMENGTWGHITIDQIVQSDNPASQSPINTPPNATAQSKDTSAAVVKQLQNFERIRVSKGTPEYEAARAEIERQNGRSDLTLADQLKAAQQLRERLWNDPHRPTYHMLPPDGPWNDINGTLYWNGRYHVFFLGRQAPETDVVLDGKDSMRSREIWLHASSADLVHWVWHKPALVPDFDGTMSRGIFSGGAVAGADRPTLIYHVPGMGTCIATAADDDLINWTPSPNNPVIAQPRRGESPEYVVFDPAAWKAGDTYYALVGNRNTRPGYEGDTTSLFKSKDMVSWEYLHPLYKSDRKWTHADEDAACPDFFPIGNGKHMLITHVHMPTYRVQYYIGTFNDEVFTPEQHGYMSWPGGQMSGPETLLDAQGRRIFWGWIREAKPARNGWASVASLPRVLELDADNTLRISPAPELEILRTSPRALENIAIAPDSEVILENIRGNTMEMEVTFAPNDKGAYGVIVSRADDASEQTAIIYSPTDKTLRIDVSRASLDKSVRYETVDRRYARSHGMAEEKITTTEQVAPLELKDGEPLTLRIFIDRSVLEVFANNRQALTQRIYPTRADSLGTAVFAKGAPATVDSVKAWKLSPTNSW